MNSGSFIITKRTNLLAISVASISMKMLYYAISFLLVVSTNTFWSLLGNNAITLDILIILFQFLMIVILWTKMSISKIVLSRVLLWGIIISASFLLVCIFGGFEISRHWVLFGVLLVETPVFLYLLKGRGEDAVFLRSFTNLVAIIAIASLLIWTLGPMMNKISTNSMVYNTWVTNSVPYYVSGYYNFLYLVQTQDLGFQIWKNTCLFTEAPMFSYVLSAAYIIELFLNERPRKFVLAILAITTFSTFSTTGIMIVVVGFCAYYYMRSKQSGKGITFRTFVMLAIVIVATYILTQLLETKLGSTSGSIRLDDYFAGFYAWLDSPIFGHGFSGYENIVGYQSQFRAYNSGFSNSPMYILAIGGISLFTIYVISFLGLFISKQLNIRIFGFMFLLIFAMTIISSLPLSSLLMSIGIVNIIGAETNLRREYLVKEGVSLNETNNNIWNL